jgi:hypothetical protein
MAGCAPYGNARQAVERVSEQETDMISRSLRCPARRAVLALVASMLLAPSMLADITTGIGASASASGAVLNNGITMNQAPYASDGHSSLRDASVSSESASATTSTGTVSLSQNVLVDTNNDIQQITWQGAGSGSASATAEWGALHAVATGTESVTPGTFTYMYYDADGNPTAIPLVTPLTAQGGASAEAYYTDAFTVTSSTLAAGTQVSVLFTFTLDGVTNVAGYPAAITANYQFDYASPYRSPDSLAQLYITSTGSSTQASILENVFVGEVFGISGTLTASAGAPQACTPPVCDQQTLTASAQNTSKMFVDAQTQGVSLQSFSGHNYSTPTSAPEPASLTLMVTGLAGLAGALRRRR